MEVFNNKTMDQSKNKILLVIMAVLSLLGIGGGAAYLGGPGGTEVTASTTVFSLTDDTSLQLLGTSSRRVAFQAQVYNCSNATSTVTLRLSSDSPATGINGISVYASSTEKFGDNAEIPMYQNAIQGIVNGVSCTVRITEWREATLL